MNTPRQSFQKILTMLIAVFFASAIFVYADWSPPPTDPPTCPAGTDACYAPINVSGNPQDKYGGLGLGLGGVNLGLTVHSGSVLAQGTQGVTPVTGPGTRLMWIPSKAAFRAGSVDGDQWNDGNIGQNSVAFGRNSYASGNNSLALGNVKVEGAESIGIGRNLIVRGNKSFGLNVSDTSYTINQDDTIAIMGGNVGINKLDPVARVDVNGVIRSVGQGGTLPDSGVGIEAYYTGSTGVLVSADRNTSTYKPLQIFGYPLQFSTDAPALGGAMRLTRTGLSVGDLNTDPTHRLDVFGAMRLNPVPGVGVPASKGVIFYDITLDKFRCYQGSAWTDCIGSGGSPPPASVVDTSENVRIIRGVVYDNGTPYLNANYGYTITKVGLGSYQINYSAPFSTTPPTITVSIRGTGTGGAAAVAYSNFAEVSTYNSAGVKVDRDFNFIIIGQQ